MVHADSQWTLRSSSPIRSSRSFAPASLGERRFMAGHGPPARLSVNRGRRISDQAHEVPLHGAVALANLCFHAPTIENFDAPAAKADHLGPRQFPQRTGD